MPDEPSWDFIADAARQLTDKESEIYGICLRGKPGWGENTAFITTLANSFGARWFDEEWRPQFDQPEWKEALTFYLDLMGGCRSLRERPRTASTRTSPLFQQGKCGMWIDATVAASFVTNPNDSEVADSVGFAMAPDRGPRTSRELALGVVARHPGELGTRSMPQKSSSPGRRREEYLELVASRPRAGPMCRRCTRTSLYENPQYLDAAPFAQMTLDSIKRRRPDEPDGPARALCRCAVRGDSRVPGYRHGGRPDVLGRARGADGRRSGAAEPRSS